MTFVRITRHIGRTSTARLPRRVDDWPGAAKRDYYHVLKQLNAWDRDLGQKFSPLQAETTEMAIRQCWETRG